MCVYTHSCTKFSTYGCSRQGKFWTFRARSRSNLAQISFFKSSDLAVSPDLVKPRLFSGRTTRQNFASLGTYYTYMHHIWYRVYPWIVPAHLSGTVVYTFVVYTARVLNMVRVLKCLKIWIPKFSDSTQLWWVTGLHTGPYLNSSTLFLFSPKTNRKIIYLPNLAQNWAKFAILKC
jgi:hypothetical protein